MGMQVNNASKKTNSEGKMGWLRYISVCALIVPLFLFLTACGGGVTETNNENDNQDNLTSELEQFKTCVDLAQSDQQPAKYLILIVMDNSGSMCDIHIEFTDKLAGLFSNLPTSGASIRIGVVSTDMVNSGHIGELRTSPTYPTARWADIDLANPAAGVDIVSEAILNIGKTLASSCNGHHVERGADAALTALGKTESGMVNEGFLDDQADAIFVPVYISDEQDDSATSGLFSNYPVGHLGEFDRYVGSGLFASHTQIGVIHNEPVPNSCGVVADGDEYGTTYLDLLDESGGLDFFICDDWDDTFASLAESVFQPQLCATLEAGLIASTIEASLADGTPVTDFTYDQDTGEVCFNPGVPGTNSGEITTFCGLPITGEE